MLINYLKEYGVNSVFHYVPLHNSSAGLRYGRFCGEDRYTTSESERLLRLPIYPNLDVNLVEKIIDLIIQFYNRI